MVPAIKVTGYRLQVTGLILTFIFCLPSFVFNCYAGAPKQIRVAVVQDAASLVLKINGPYEVMDSPAKNVLYRGQGLKTTVAPDKDGILLAGRKFSKQRLFIQANNLEKVVSLNGRKFKGDIEIVKTAKGFLSAVNYIALEDYVKGILYHEVSHYWPQDALRAQAIVCRTYAIYQAQENISKDFDLTADIYSQVYGGMESERQRTTMAVDDTKGKVIVYQGKVIPAYYHATCAGHTENASLLWSIDLAPLSGIPCGFCKLSVHFNWHLVLSMDDLTGALKKMTGKSYRRIKNITILTKDVSGRVQDLEIIADGKTLKIAAKDLRNSVGPNIIKSANFTVNVVDGDIVFEGYGWGHGVGLCQWGSYFMAKKGSGFSDILQYYYPQTDVEVIGF